MTSFRNIYTVNLTQEQRDAAMAIPKKRHYRDGVMLAAPKSLAIAKSPATDEYYLFYYNDRGEEQSDTLHDTLDDAFDFAEVEFGIERSQWSLCGT